MDFKKIVFLIVNLLIGLSILVFFGLVFFFLAILIAVFLSPIIESDSLNLFLIIVAFISSIVSTIKIAKRLHSQYTVSKDSESQSSTEEPPEYVPSPPPKPPIKRLKFTYKDELFPDCVEIVLETGVASAGRFQTGLKIGSIRAESILTEMEEQGIIGPQNRNHPREVFIDWEQWKNSEKIHISQKEPPVRKPIRRCVNCGSEIDPGVKFCPDCGNSTTQFNRTSSTQNKWRPYYARNCARCGSQSISYDTVVESNEAGCMTCLLYVFLALTIFGLLIVIPLMLRSNTRTVTYAVCQNCGRRWRVY